MCVQFFFIFYSFILSAIKRVSSTWCLLTIPRSHLTSLPSALIHIFNCSGGGCVCLYAYVAQSSDGFYCVFRIHSFNCYATVLWKYKWSLCILTMRLPTAQACFFYFTLHFIFHLFLSFIHSLHLHSLDELYKTPVIQSTKNLIYSYYWYGPICHKQNWNIHRAIWLFNIWAAERERLRDCDWDKGP